jgi:hypothetical protein
LKFENNHINFWHRCRGSSPLMIGSCLVSLPLRSTRLFGSYGFGLSSSAIFGSEGVVPPEISWNSSPQPPTSFLTPPVNNPALRSNSLSQLLSHTISQCFSPNFPPLSATLEQLLFHSFHQFQIYRLVFTSHFCLHSFTVHVASNHDASPASAFVRRPSHFISPVHGHG